MNKTLKVASIKTSLKTNSAFLLSSLIACSLLLSGCGFKLRGYESSQGLQSLITSVNQSVIVSTDDNQTGFAVKNPLEQKLQTLGVSTLPLNTNNDNASIIKVEKINFKQYELLGVLTEIRVIISANISYKIVENGKNKTVQDTIQVERSYQFNEASISVENQQNKQVKQWLYDALAQRIADQYFALTAF